MLALNATAVSLDANLIERIGRWRCAVFTSAALFREFDWVRLEIARRHRLRLPSGLSCWPAEYEYSERACEGQTMTCCPRPRGHAVTDTHTPPLDA